MRPIIKAKQTAPVHLLAGWPIVESERNALAETTYSFSSDNNLRACFKWSRQSRQSHFTYFLDSQSSSQRGAHWPRRRTVWFANIYSNTLFILFLEVSTRKLLAATLRQQSSYKADNHTLLTFWMANHRVRGERIGRDDVTYAVARLWYCIWRFQHTRELLAATQR